MLEVHVGVDPHPIPPKPRPRHVWNRTGKPPASSVATMRTPRR